MAEINNKSKERKYDHTVLIVDDENQIGKSIGRLLKTINVKYVYLESGEEGLEWLQKAKKPFSLIISDQRMPKMQGAEFLERAKEISPDSIRYLVTGYSDVDAITDAVNKGAIHRYIAKPWNNNELIEVVQSGLEQHALIMENHRLFRLAKEQNAKLYDLNLKLKESAAAHKKSIADLDNQIKDLKEQLKKGFKRRDYVDEIERLLKEKNMLNTEDLNSLYSGLLLELFEQFQDIATRNGVEMPDNI